MKRKLLDQQKITKPSISKKKNHRPFLVLTLLLFFTISTFSHVTRIRVKQNQDGSLTWRVETYHRRGQCGVANSGIRINGVSYPLQFEAAMNESNRFSLPNDGFTLFANAPSNWPGYLYSYGQVTTPYIPGTLNVQPYSTNVCWAFAVGGNGAFNPPPPPVCTSFPLTSASSSIISTNDNGTPCDLSDDTSTVNLTANHLACGNITGDKKFTAYLESNGTSSLIGEFNYLQGITTPLGSINVNSGQSYNLRLEDNDFPGNVLNYPIPLFNGVPENIAPTIVLNGPATTTVAVNGTFNDPGATATDNCGTATVNVSGTINFAVAGNYVLSYTAVDPSGNVSSPVTRTVTVVPIQAKAKDITIALDSNGNATIQPTDLDGGSILGGGTLSLSQSSFNCNNIGTNNVTLTVTSSNGSTSVSDVGIVTVIDNTSPNVITKNISIQLDDSGNTTITPEMIDNGSSDACGIQSLSLNNSTFNCANVGTNEVILTVTDMYNNTASSSAIVTIEDNTPPQVIVQNISIDLDENGNANITPDMIDNGSNDACGIQSLSLNTNSFDCSNLGTNEVTLTVVDVNGNTASGSANVIVNDITKPTVITQNTSVTLANGIATITPADVDGDTFDNCSFTLSLDNNSFTCDNIGENIVNLTATDSSGNTASKTAIINVIGEIPIISIDDFTAVQTQKTNTIYLGYGPSSINLNTQVSGGSGFTYEWTTSTGEIVSNEANPSITPTVSTTYNVTVTNSNGCSASTSLYVCVIDARAFDKKGRYRGKVKVCHHTNGKKGTKHVEISISASAVMTHLTQHGVGTDHADSLGGCNATCTTNNSSKGVTKTEENFYNLLDNLNVYPNPSNGIFDIKLTSISSETSVLLFDTTGKLIERKTISKENSTNNIVTVGNYNLASGIYLVKISNNKETISKKLIVARN